MSGELNTSIISNSPASPVADVTGDLHLIARTPAEMQAAQATFVAWCENKIAILSRDLDEASENLQIATKNNWNPRTFERQANLLVRRINFYLKMKAIAEAGYCIVPNFPIDVFAIRTTRKTPDKQENRNQYDQKQQESNAPPLGEGRYVDSLPEVWRRDYPKIDQKTGMVARDEAGREVKDPHYHAESFDEEIDFPISVARPEIMSATAEAMALNAFDEIGVLPGDRNRRAKGDPLVIGRIIDPRGPKYSRKYVSFIIAWYVDTKAL